MMLQNLSSSHRRRRRNNQKKKDDHTNDNYRSNSNNNLYDDDDDSTIASKTARIVIGLLFVIVVVSLSVVFVNMMTTTTMVVNAFVMVPKVTKHLQMGSARKMITTKAITNDILLKATTVTNADVTTAITDTLPRISTKDLRTLQIEGYVVIENFIPPASQLKEALRDDVQNLRSNNKFKVAKIGQDSTNTLNEEIRVAETCFLGRDKPQLQDAYNQRREQLYDVLESIRIDLEENVAGNIKLDPKLSEFLYAYYPKGGFYRRHRDAVKGSASYLRQYSLLLYLNDDDYNSETDGGQLRIHLDSGGDFLPAGEEPNFKDINANGGTLVLFESSKFPHEVLDTTNERFAVVGWYNRPMSFRDISAITASDTTANNNAAAAVAANNNGDGDNSTQMIALAAAAGLVTVGLINLIGAM